MSSPWNPQSPQQPANSIDPYGTPAPQYGTQPYGAQPYQSYGARPYYGGSQASTNGLAIASLVTSILGISLIGVILGHVAISQINKTGEQGKGMAIAGLVLGYLGMLVGIIIFLAVLSDPSTYTYTNY